MQHVNMEQQELRGKYDELKPYLDRIDTVAESVEQLLAAARQLEDYSKRLGGFAMQRLCISNATLHPAHILYVPVFPRHKLRS